MRYFADYFIFDGKRSFSSIRNKLVLLLASVILIGFNRILLFEPYKYITLGFALASELFIDKHS